jgi:ribosomal protein S18 acetylase RimI-like enzyme
VNLRRPTEADVPAVTELIRAVEVDLVGKAEQTEGDLRDEWARLDLERDVWLVELDGRLAACVAVAIEGRPIFIGYVHPNCRGRGIGTELVDLCEEEGRARGLEKLQTAVLTADERAQELLRARGYDEARRYYRMAIDLDEPPAAPDWPPGLDVAPVEAAEIGRFHDTLDEAFAEEWGHEPEHGVDWRSVRETRHPDHSLWFVVKDGEEIAGAAVADEDRRGVGWVAAIGVRKPWRRRGLGEALLLHCFRELGARGKRKIALGVDAENPTGAMRLYERAGMHVARTAVFFEKAL